MPRQVVFLDKNTLAELKNSAKESNKSRSKIAAEMIETGLNMKRLQTSKISQKRREKINDLIGKHTEYLLRIIAINSDILRCTRNDKSKYKTQDTDDILKNITENVQTYIEGYIGEGQ